MALLVDTERRVLLGKRVPDRKAYPCCWDVLGGHVDEGEGLAQALVREVEEEAGLTPTRFDLHATFLEPNPAINGQITYHLFVVREWRGGSALTPSGEHTDMGWFSMAQARSLPDLAMPRYREMFDEMAGSHG